jgi:hypothetical protein
VSVNQDTPLTPHRGYTSPGTPGNNTLLFDAARIKQGFADIDEDVKDVYVAIQTAESNVDDLSDSVGTLTTDLNSAESAIATAQADILKKASILTSATVSNLLYDGNGNVTFYEDAEILLNNFVYTSGNLISYREKNKLNNVEQNVTLTYSGSNVMSIAVTPV